MYLERIKFVCEMVTKLWVFIHSPLVLKIPPTIYYLKKQYNIEMGMEYVDDTQTL